MIELTQFQFFIGSMVILMTGMLLGIVSIAFGLIHQRRKQVLWDESKERVFPAFRGSRSEVLRRN